MLRDYDNTGGGLEQLYLDGNDLSQSDSIQYIAQALRRNQRLSVLSMRNCRMDAKGCTMIGEALKYNQHLIKLDISCNPICNNLDGIICIKQALNVNHCLQDLCLADTGLDTEGTIALAESFSENNSLVRLDLTKNPRIGIAGVMALSASIKMNQMITCIDINIAANDEEMVEIHNGLLVTCTRNAQMKKNRNNSIEIQPSESLDNNNNLARLTLEERLAAAVTKNTTNKEDVRMSQLVVKENTDDTLLIQQALDDVGLLEDIEEQKDKTTFNNIYNKCKKTHSSILQRIPEVTNPSHLGMLV
ncbi:uncharacterized protein BX663DRAFT_500230 [Cokeromyces recurvatus]|uniref:uncharacterized protein n=1 Tax=Cokeromyces recurvatus TaxID=90255 RepID=UPI002220A7E5|nr:uncharacterized protein BX663DRAFT_500230 [Cokeromyces recurvatus]KAI7905584.1 hypothetical protein BX663DRAFT_500230 [Cokeromyces recurvatus]